KSPTKFASPGILHNILLDSQPALSLLPLHRSALESSPDSATLSEEEARLLLAALVQDYVQMKASELEQEQETEGFSIPRRRIPGDRREHTVQESSRLICSGGLGAQPFSGSRGNRGPSAAGRTVIRHNKKLRF
uniref:Calcitonin n=1 Tax=Theropithecus gelada TaxID=9565 RepID=A0A8D2F8H8_THEGE